jgi:hypothetical protein
MSKLRDYYQTVKSVIVRGFNAHVPVGLDKDAEQKWIDENVIPVLESPEFISRREKVARNRATRDATLAAIRERAAERLENGGPTNAELERAAKSAKLGQALVTQYPNITDEGRSKAKLAAQPAGTGQGQPEGTATTS